MAKGNPKATARGAGASLTTQGPVKKMAAQVDTVAADLAALKIDFNALLAKLRAAGHMA